MSWDSKHIKKTPERQSLRTEAKKEVDYSGRKKKQQAAGASFLPSVKMNKNPA